MTDPTPYGKRSPLEHERDMEGGFTTVDFLVSCCRDPFTGKPYDNGEQADIYVADLLTIADEYAALEARVKELEAVVKSLSRLDTQADIDRAKREARVEGIEAAAKPLTDAEAVSICLTYRHDYGLLPPRDREAMIWQAKEWHNAMRHHFRALIEAEERGEGKP